MCFITHSLTLKYRDGSADVEMTWSLMSDNPKAIAEIAAKAIEQAITGPQHDLSETEMTELLKSSSLPSWKPKSPKRLRKTARSQTVLSGGEV